MRVRLKNKIFVYWSLLLFVAFCCFLITEGKGGSGSGSGGGGGGRGGGGRGYAYGGRSARSSRISGKKIIGGAAVAVGVAAAYKHGTHRFHSNPVDNPAFLSGGGGTIDDEEDYKLQESSYYSRGDGFGMSAVGLIFLILGIIGVCTLIWYLCEFGIPVFRDSRNFENRDSMGPIGREKHLLQETTPSTATPSP